MNTLVQRFALLLVSVLLAGCGGETQLDVVKTVRPQYEAFSKQLADMAGMEPKAAVRPPAPLDPKPVLKGNNVESNTAVFMSEQLRDPRAGLAAPVPMDLQLSGRVLTQIRMGTAPDANLTGKATKILRKELTEALQVRYIGAVRMVAVKPAVVVGTEGFHGGNVKGVVMLFDRGTMKLLFADAFTAESDSQIGYTRRKDTEPDNKALQAWADSNLQGNTKTAVLKKFSEGTGGIFVSDTF